MAGTFSQIYMQIVFAVKGRGNLLLPSFEEDVYKYISGIVSGKGQKPLAVNGMPDHVHVLVGLKPSMYIADLVRDIKNNSTNFINSNKWLKINSTGRKVMVRFPMLSPITVRLSNILKIKSSITRNKLSGMNTFPFKKI